MKLNWRKLSVFLIVLLFCCISMFVIFYSHLFIPINPEEFKYCELNDDCYLDITCECINKNKINLYNSWLRSRQYLYEEVPRFCPNDYCVCKNNICKRQHEIHSFVIEAATYTGNNLIIAYIRNTGEETLDLTKFIAFIEDKEVDIISVNIGNLTSSEVAELSISNSSALYSGPVCYKVLKLSDESGFSSFSSPYIICK